MSDPQHDALLMLALGVLSEPPCSVDVLSEDGGSFPMQLLEPSEGFLHAQGPRAAMRKDLLLLARVSDPERGRYEVEFVVDEAFFHSTSEALVHLKVSAVRHRKARRAAPRAAVSVSATANVRFCRSMPRGSELDVRLVDLSTTGLAFVTQRELDPGDLITLEALLVGRPMVIETRVVRVDPAPYGRYRAGCEITEISDGDRTAISELADKDSSTGEFQHRNPDEVAMRAEVRANRNNGMADRLGLASGQ
jgi:PilZ domain-containing protein